MKSNYDWEVHGSKDPYFGVYSDDAYKQENLSPAARSKFFESGYDYWTRLFDEIELKGHRYENGLDFGCGVGRLSIPMKAYSERLTCVDISPSMLEECRKNFDEQSSSDKCRFLSTSAFLHETESYDFINCYIVLQHLEKPYGIELLGEMLDRLSIGGDAFIHLTYHHTRKWYKIREFIKGNMLLYGLSNLLRGKNFSEPAMKMTMYDLGAIVQLFRKFNITIKNTMYTDHRGALGVIFRLKKCSALDFS